MEHQPYGDVVVYIPPMESWRVMIWWALLRMMMTEIWEYGPFLNDSNVGAGLCIDFAAI